VQSDRFAPSDNAFVISVHIDRSTSSHTTASPYLTLVSYQDVLRFAFLILFAVLFYPDRFVGAFTDLRKAALSLLMSVRMEQLCSAPSGRIFMKSDILGFFRVETYFKFKICQMKGTLHADHSLYMFDHHVYWTVHHCDS